MIDISQKEFTLLATHIKNQYGIVIKDEKKDLLVGRLYRLVEQMGMQTFTQYYKYLLRDTSGHAANLLINQITTNHTYFMREASQFDFLIKEMLPYWKKRIHDYDLRIWCAACATGEEAYTLAMIVDYFLGYEKKHWDSKILATDLSKQVLEHAEIGQYKVEEVSKLPVEWQSRYLKRIDEHS